MTATQHVHWDLDYEITLGATWSRFMDGLRDKRILGTRCARCERTFVPAQAFCEDCFEPASAWVELPDRGVLELHTVVRQGFVGGPAVPYAIGAIRLEGASTLLFHRLSGADLGDGSDASALAAGTPVRAVWASQRTGTILDIESFRVTP